MFAHNSRMQSSIIGRAQWQEPETTGRITDTISVRMERSDTCVLYSALFLFM